jgi:RsmE family RNA methyltransferase
MNIILFKAGESLTSLPKHDARAIHLTKVLHKKAGDAFLAGVVGGKRGLGRVESADGGITFSLDLNEEAPPRHPLFAAVGFPRQIQLRRLLRDLSSMGLSGVSLFPTELGEKSYRETTLLKDGGAAEALLEGAVQSRDTTLPALTLFASFDQWLAHEKEQGRTLLAADWTGVEPSFGGLEALHGGVTIAVGSERGWSQTERSALKDSGFRSLALGSRALRTETACVAASALILMKMGFF